MKNTDHWFEAGIGWGNRVVSNNKLNEVVGVGIISNRLNLHT